MVVRMHRQNPHHNRDVIKLGKPWLREGYQSSTHELIMCILVNQLLDSNLSKEQKSSICMCVCDDRCVDIKTSWYKERCIECIRMSCIGSDQCYST
jgi:hypothetical protein